MTGVALIIVGVALSLWSIWLYLRPVSGRVLEQRYQRPASRFIDVEGTRVHVFEEGPMDGPVIVVLSAHWGSFISWDDWAAQLTDRCRVIRIDLPGHGLTGRIPGGDYSMGRYVQLLHGVIRNLTLETFALVGTSFSGIVAYQYAAQFGDQLSALILINSSGLPRDTKSGQQPNQAPPHFLYRLIQRHYRPYGFFKWKLGDLVVSQDRLTADKIRIYTDMNNRTGRIAEERSRLQLYSATDPKPVLETIRVPTLVQWSTESPYLNVKQADTFCKHLKNTKTWKIVYPNTGHLIVEDCPQVLAQDTRRFLEACVYNTVASQEN